MRDCALFPDTRLSLWLLSHCKTTGLRKGHDSCHFDFRASGPNPRAAPCRAPRLRRPPGPVPDRKFTYTRSYLEDRLFAIYERIAPSPLKCTRRTGSKRHLRLSGQVESVCENLAPPIYPRYPDGRLTQTNRKACSPPCCGPNQVHAESRCGRYSKPAPARSSPAGQDQIQVLYQRWDHQTRV